MSYIVARIIKIRGLINRFPIESVIWVRVSLPYSESSVEEGRTATREKNVLVLWTRRWNRVGNSRVLAEIAYRPYRSPLKRSSSDIFHARNSELVSTWKSRENPRTSWYPSPSSWRLAENRMEFARQAWISSTECVMASWN